jgi:hypothetical protein
MKKTKTGYRGVSKIGHKYQARIRKDGKHLFLGSFASAEEASQAYENALAEKQAIATDVVNQPSLDGETPQTMSIRWDKIDVPDRVEELIAAAIAGSIFTLLVIH